MQEYHRVIGYNNHNPQNLQKIPENTGMVMLRDSKGNSEDQGKKFKNALINLIPNFIEGFFTPQNIAFMLALNGVPFTGIPGITGLPELIINSMIKQITGLSEEAIQAAASEIIGKDITGKSVDEVAEVLTQKLANKITTNVAKDIINRVTSSAAGEVEAAGNSAAEEVIENISADIATKIAEGAAEEIVSDSIAASALSSLSSLLSGVGTIFGVLMMVNMILDAWDPCGYNNTLNASTIQIFNDLYNKTFRDMYIGKVFVTNDREGNAIYSSEWPVEYFPDNDFINTDKGEIMMMNNKTKKVDYEELYSEYYFEYLDNLTHNSNGYPICNRANLACESIKATKPLSQSDIDEITGIIHDFTRGFDRNSKVDTFLERYWIIIVFVIILILIILFYIE